MLNIIKLSKIALFNSLDKTERLLLLPVGGFIGGLFAVFSGVNDLVALFGGMIFGLFFGFFFQFLFSTVEVLIRINKQKSI